MRNLLKRLKNRVLVTMARIDQVPSERDQHSLQLDVLLDCPKCEETFDFVFQAPEDVYDLEDLIDAPEAVAECPKCGHKWKAQYEGWVAHEDAG